MNHDPFNKEPHLRKKLKEYHVDIPDFPMKASRWERFINLLASPAKDPIDPIISSTNGQLVLTLVPLAAVAFAFLQVFIFI